MKISGKQGTWINEVRNIFEKIQCSDIFENNVPDHKYKRFPKLCPGKAHVTICTYMGTRNS